MYYYHLLLAKTKDVGDDLEGFVDKRMAPFSAHLGVAPYKEKCYCIGQIARDEASKAGDKKFGTWKEMREAYERFMKVVNERNVKHGEEPMTGDEMLDFYRRLYLTPREQFERKFFLAHKLHNKPDPTCGFHVGPYWETQAKIGKLKPELLGKRYEDESGCGGTGKTKSTANPQGYWDYWRIGGGWSGALDGYTPTKDEKNIETCNICKGTGDRPGWVIWNGQEKNIPPPEGRPLTEQQIKDFGLERTFKDDWAKDCNGCNGCHGKGVYPKWPTSWTHHEGDVQPVKALVGNKDHVPYSIILPDGSWVEKPATKVSVDHVAIQKVWDEKVLDIFKKYQDDHVAIVIDYHNCGARL